MCFRLGSGLTPGRDGHQRLKLVRGKLCRVAAHSQGKLGSMVAVLQVLDIPYTLVVIAPQECRAWILCLQRDICNGVEQHHSIGF